MAVKEQQSKRDWREGRYRERWIWGRPVRGRARGGDISEAGVALRRTRVGEEGVVACPACATMQSSTQTSCLGGWLSVRRS